MLQNRATTVTIVLDKKCVSGQWPGREGFLAQQMAYVLSKIWRKKLACGLGDPSDGLHERINWNAV